MYTITGIDAVADLTTAVWVEAVATVGISAVEFTGAVGAGVVGMGWLSTITLCLLLAGMVLLLMSLFLGPGSFLVMGLVFWGMGTGAWL